MDRSRNGRDGRRVGGARLLMATSALAIATGAQAGETTTYSYDALGRLTAASSSGTVNNGLANSVCYDPAGNRTVYQSSSTGALPTCPATPPPPPGNAPPTTAADSLSIPACGSGSINVTANDTDPEGNYPLALVSVTSSAKATATVASASTINVQSPGTLTGTAALTYTVADSLGGTSTGTLNVTVTAGTCQ